MSFVWVILVAVGAADPALKANPVGRPPVPFSVVLASPKLEYLLGEPVVLDLFVTNKGSEPRLLRAHGWGDGVQVLIGPGGPPMELYDRGAKALFVTPPSDWWPIGLAPRKQPGKGTKSGGGVAWDLPGHEMGAGMEMPTGAFGVHAPPHVSWALGWYPLALQDGLMPGGPGQPGTATLAPGRTRQYRTRLVITTPVNVLPIFAWRGFSP